MIYLEKYLNIIKSLSGNKYWFLIVDEVSGIIRIIFSKEKYYLKSEVIPVIFQINFARIYLKKHDIAI